MLGFNYGRLALVAIVVTLCMSRSHAQNTDIQIEEAAAASVFFSPTRDLAFALNVPDDDSTEDLYFTLQIPTGIAWGAVGLGSDTMDGALVLMAYSSSSGQNLTLSPRLSSGHTEPVYTSDIHVEALPGTGLVNETTYIYNGRCGNCRSWATGRVDVKSTTQNMLYATGESGDIRSDDVQFSLGMHYNYGSFTLDMEHATGAGGVPEIAPTDNPALVATAQGESVEGHKDKVAMAHALIMIFCFLGLFPFGTLVLRLGNWVRWHAINQGIALVLVILGFGTGVLTSGFYNRSKNFNSAHQVIGILVFAFVIIQFGLGFMHHRVFKKTQQTTKMAPVHIWLGRLIILLGVINGFLGFSLARKPKYNYVLLGLVLFIFPAIILLLLTKKFLWKWWKEDKEVDNGYKMEPWHQGGAEPPSGPSAGTHAAGPYAPRADFGPPQNAREYV